MRGLWIHRALERLLPPRFRSRFGDEMREMRQERARLVADSSQPWAGVTFWMGESWDLVVTIAREWARVIMGSRMPRLVSGVMTGGVDMRDDVKLALRSVGRNPAFSAVVIITLALGIGANTAIFTVVDTMVLREMPYPGADRIMHFRSVDTQSGGQSIRVAYADFQEFRDDVGAFESLAGYSNETWIHSGDGIEPHRIATSGVTQSFFDVLGVEPELGRTFAPEEHHEGNRRYLVMSHSFWSKAYGSDPSIVGQSIMLDQTAYQVIGVMPAGFDYPYLREMEGWTPLLDRAFVTNDTTSAFSERDWTVVAVVGRLADGVSVERAQSEVGAMSSALAEAYPSTNERISHELVPLKELETASIRRPMLLTLGAVAAILLIACVNVASLLLARGAARAPEVAMRLALGAGRVRLVRLFLVESLLYALLGGVAGIILGAWMLELLPSLGVEAPRLDHVRLDRRVLAIVLGGTLVTGLASGLLPALRGSRFDPARTLQNAGRGGRIGAAPIQRTLVAFELAATTVLVVGAGLLVNSLGRTLSEDPGFDAEGVLTMRLNLPGRYMGDPDDNWAGANGFFDELTAEVAAVPGVSGVGLSYANPLEPQRAFTARVEIPSWLERPRSERPVVDIRPADPGYFDVFSIPLVRGRLLESTDRKDTEGVAVVNESFVRLVFGDEDPIGYPITGPNFWGPSGYPYPWRIVGVVGDVKSAGLASAPAPAVYLPVTQAPMGNLRLVVKTAGDAEALIPAMRAAVWDIDSELPVDELRTMEQEIAKSTSVPRFAATTVGVFALIAMILAAVGVFGVLSYSVGLRSREFGVRQALGARSNEVLGLVVGQGVRTALVGVGAGLVVAAYLSRTLQAFLYDVPPIDPLTYSAVAALLIVVVVVACIVPARRAMSVDPAVVLDSE